MKTASKPYRLTEEMQQAIATADGHLSKILEIDNAIERNKTELSAAQTAHAAAVAEQTEIETALARTTDAKRAAVLEKEADAARDAAEQKQRVLERIVRIGKALDVQANEADGEVQTIRAAFSVAQGKFNTAMAQEFFEELQVAIKPLLETLLRGRAIRDTIHSQTLIDFFFEIVVPDPTSSRSPFVKGNIVKLNGNSVKLMEACQADEEASEIFGHLSTILDIKNRLGRHEPRALKLRDRTPKSHSYTISFNNPKPTAEVGTSLASKLPS
ncbi:MAG TPA: hypothetical protein VFW00_02580 [Rhodocyclaceae bacterium]|nr:hypothetical protein [Rhodocyclaceae bacterium]